jgi:predicted amidohydrolase
LGKNRVRNGKIRRKGKEKKQEEKVMVIEMQLQKRQAQRRHPPIKFDQKTKILEALQNNP